MNSGRDAFVVGRREALQAICTLPVLPLVGGCEAAAPCPLCAGWLSTVGSHIDFSFLPSVNYAVWNRASDHVGCTGYEPGFETPPPGRTASNGELEISCAAEFNSQSPFCKRCFHAFSQRDQQWKRIMNTPQSFLLPLSSEVLGFPLPSRDFLLYNVVYQQIFGGVSGKENYSDSIGFWYKTTAPPSTAANIEAYVHQHNMHNGLKLAQTPGQSWVDAIYSGARPKLARV
jgi:hypothetical protein